MNYIKLIFIFCLFIPCKSYTQNTITIGEQGDFSTLSQAASSLNPGDVVIILDQVFSNDPQYLTDINGLPNQPITIIGETNQGPTFQGGSEGIHLINCNHIIIDGLVFEQQTQNSLNIDDGTNYATPSTNITVRNCAFRDIGGDGNNDFLKMSGVDNFLVTNCTFTNGNNSGLGSGLDMVGCHQGLIQDCIFDNPGSIGISCKGGSQYISIERNTFKNTSGRAVAVGGYTGLPYFRPVLPNPIVNAFEASDINVFSNVFVNDEAPIAFVGAVNSTFRNNTIYKPQNWVIRILQENTNNGFLPCSNNEFSNNIIYLQNDLVEVNIASNTNPGSFTFSHNAWYNESSSNWSPNLPAASQNQLISNPLFVNASNGDFTLNGESPCIASGFSYAEPTTDFNQTSYTNPRSRGAFEGGENPTGGECELLSNTDFDNDIAPWVYWGADVSSVNGVANITNINPGSDFWEVGFIQNNQNIILEEGEEYQVKFRARADANRTLYLRIQLGQSPYTAYHEQTVSLTTSMKEFTANFTMNNLTDNNVNFDFYMGGNGISTYIDKVSLVKVNCGSSCPQQGQTCEDGNDCTTGETYDTNCNCNGGTFQDSDQDGVCDAYDACPGTDDAIIGQLCDDGNDCTTGETYDTNCNCNGGTFQDSDQDGVCDAYDACPGTDDAIIGQLCDDGNDCTTGETYDNNCNCTGGTSQDADGDGVCAALDPDDNDPCVPNASNCGGSECELLSNGNFDNDLAPWNYWDCSPALVNGMVRLTNILNGQNVWEAALYTDNILIEQGQSYEVKFSARANVNRTMDVKVGQNDFPWANYLYETVDLTTVMQDFTFNFTMDDPTDNNTAFDFFVAGGNTANIYIDNVSLVKVNCDTPPPPPSGTCDCPDPAEPGNVVTVSDVSQLRNRLDQADSQGGNMTIKLETGTYQLDYPIVIKQNMSNLTIMGATGNRDNVFIKGKGYNGDVTAVILVQADNFTAAHLTVGESSTHAIQLQGELDADNFTAINVRFVDTYQQMLKVSTVEDDEVMNSPIFSDNGRVLCCAFEFTAGQAYNDYTRGIDALKCKNWLVSNSVFKNIRVDYNEEVEPAILFWKSSHGTTVTNNQIMNCDRGIGFGLAAPGKVHHGHTGGGLIANNFVHTNKDVGIGLQYAPDVKVYNNTVITENYPNSIEYRYSTTSNTRIFNNLTSGNITQQVNAPDAVDGDNYPVSDLSIFVDAANHDYHLAGRPSGIVDAGTSLSEVNVDIDCDNRNGGIDIGADESGDAAKEDVSLAPSFTLSPNPASHTIQLACELSENTHAQIQVYDAFGKLVKHIAAVELIAGSPIDVDVSQLPGGMYFCTLKSNEWQAVKKFVIAR